jgi:hypothetical protein
LAAKPPRKRQAPTSKRQGKFKFPNVNLALRTSGRTLEVGNSLMLGAWNLVIPPAPEQTSFWVAEAILMAMAAAKQVAAGDRLHIVRRQARLRLAGRVGKIFVEV